MVELIVGAAIVIVLAIVGVGVVRANLRPLDDIEMTAGEIAKGHLDHRVPEGDPRTEVGSLGRSLNAMLTQIERAFHAQEESEQAAHESEERMRRFIADASHELRTPLTTIRGFAAHYRMRGGAGGGRGVTAVTAAVGRSRSVIPNGRVCPRISQRLHVAGLTPEGPSLGGEPGSRPTTGCRPRTSTISSAGSRPRRPGWGCWSRTCSRWPGLTSSGRSTWPRSTCSRWRPTPCRTRGSSPPGGRSTWSSRRAPRSWWTGTSRGCGRCSGTWSTTRSRTRRRGRRCG